MLRKCFLNLITKEWGGWRTEKKRKISSIEWKYVQRQNTKIHGFWEKSVYIVAESEIFFWLIVDDTVRKNKIGPF